MRKIHLFFMIVSFNFCFSQTNGNVGINTFQPEEKLHVKGSMRATNLLLDQGPYGGTIPKLTASEGYSFLIKSSCANRITTYNVQTTGTGSQNFPAPFGVIAFKIATSTADKDWVNGYNTKINASKYLAVLNYFNFNLPVQIGNTRRLAPVAQVYTYVQDGTWWIKADYHGFAPPSSSPNGEWEVSLMVFDNSFARTFPVSIDMNGGTTASATTALIKN